jgi:poly(3-hydroxybutyrate) depolymerase
MAAMRLVFSLTALSLLGSACSADNPPSATATSASPAQSGTTVTSGNPTSGPSATSGDAQSVQSATGSLTSTGTSTPSATGNVTSTGGSAQPATGGMTGAGGGAGGTATGGMTSTGGGAGGTATGGDSGSGGAGVSGGAAGDSSSGSPGGASGMGGSGSGGAASSGEGDVEQSAGCGEPRTLENGTIDITFDGASRNYILRVPEDYDNTHPYRLVFAYAESGSSAASVVDRDYFRLATLDDTNTIFVAPDAANGEGSWSSSDVELTDEILAQLEADLCIDKTRIFATGFSFGGAMSLALACQRADVFRGVAFFSGADLTGSCNDTLTTPIAYYASQASGDSSGDPIPSSGRIKQAQFAEVNGCTAEPEATTFPAAGQPHKCTVYQGCSAGHPTVYCVFDGPHGWEPTDPGESMSWNAPAAWEFITQF